MPDGLAGLWSLKEIAATGEVFSKWSMFRPAGHSDIPTLGIILGGIITAQGVHCFSHEYVQRGLGAKNIYHAKMGTLLGCCFKVLAIFIIGAPGVIAAYLLQDQGVMPDEREKGGTGRKNFYDCPYNHCDAVDAAYNLL
jgi:hypothetical protein